MSTNKTEHLNLHQWEAADPFLREEFNENFAAIDGAAKELGDGLSGAASALSAKIDGLIAVGTYQGDNSSLADKKRLIPLDFTPRFVFVCARHRISSSNSMMDWEGKSLGVAATDAPQIVPGSTERMVEVTEGGFYVGGYRSFLNGKNEKYIYLAVK